MAQGNEVTRSHWGSRIGFVLAAAGSAIGLGNIWKFPYITGQNGGGAFVLVYLLCIVAVGLPIFLAELYIGRSSQSNTVTAFEVLHRPKSGFRWIGLLGVFSAFLILSFYGVVGGWVLDFVGKSALNQFAGHSDVEIKETLTQLFHQPGTQIAWQFVFMSLTVAIVIGGVQSGIERWNKILMPALMGILVLLLVRSVSSDGFSESLVFLFNPDFSKLSGAAVLEAVGHAFFTLSLGMGAMITYGSYLDQNTPLLRTGMIVAAMDTIIALAAGIVIFSAVFSYDLEAGAGPTLMFQTLPVLFSKMTGGYWVAVGFFLLVAFAALTSAVALLEVVVAYADETLNLPRKRTTLALGIIIFCLGILSALSTNILSDVKLFDRTFFDFFDHLTSRITLPLGGFMISVFFGWTLGPKAVAAALGRPEQAVLTQLVLWSARIVAPLAVAITLFHGLS